MTKKAMQFEEAVVRLDEIVRRLEKGEVSLEESLALFEEGTRLIKSCGKQLDQAEQKVVRLMKDVNGQPVETDFTEEA